MHALLRCRRLASRRLFSSIPSKMRVVEVKQQNNDPPTATPDAQRRRRPGPDSLHVTEAPTPEVGEGEVLVKVATAGVNRPDVLQRLGLYPPPPGHSPYIGLEVAGTVVAVGPSVPESPGLSVGDSVMALANGGGYAEYCAVPHGQCLDIPSNIDMIQAGCIPETFFTVWHNLFQQQNVFGTSLKKGDSVLIHGGTSGIGSTAIQMAKSMGLTPYATAGSTKKCEACLELGAVAAINYKTEDFVMRMKELTNGKGLNLVLDMVAGPYLTKNLQVLATEGRIAVIGSLGGVHSELSMRDLMRRRLTVGGSTLRARDNAIKAKIASDLKEHIWPMIEKGQISVRVDTMFDMEEAAEAHRLMESSRHIGKIALRISKP
uniref:Enoyl reductase (ER) domain-containing protein n=1 Tax=Lotharella oceanica TaxID=641309 RepID=A0A7S2TQJ6_9EUKA